MFLDKAILKPGVILLAVFIFGSVVRVWMIVHTNMHPYPIDVLFDALGWNLANGAGMTLDGSTPSVHYGPVYPSLLALFYLAVGHRPDWVPYMQALVDVGTGFCVYQAGRLLFGPWVGVLSATAFFLYPAYWTYDLRIRMESLQTLLTSAWLWAAVGCALFGRFRLYAVSGVLAGLTILCKPVAIPAALLLAALPAVSLRSRDAVLPRLVAYLGCILLVVTPWVVRNFQAFGSFIPVSTGIGVGLWTGSDPVSNGSWPMSSEEETQLWKTAGIDTLAYPNMVYEVPIDSMLKRKALERLKEDPGGYLKLIGIRTVQFWVGNYLYLANSDLGFREGFRRDVNDRGIVVAAYSLGKRLLLIPVVLALAFWASWHFRAQWRELWPLYALPAGITAAYVPFTVEAGRYALPVLPCVFILAVAGVWNAIFRRKEEKSLLS